MLGRSACRSPRARRRPHFLEEAGRQHGVEALRDAFVAATPGRLGSSEQEQVGAQRTGARSPWWKDDSGRPVSRTTSRRALDALGIVGRQAAAVAGSTAASCACRAGQPVRAASASMPRARGIGRRHGVQPFEQGLEVQHGAAGKHDTSAARADLAHQPRRIRPRIRRRCTAARDRGCRSGGAARVRARPRVGLAVPMSMPRYTRAESTLDDLGVQRLCEPQRRGALAGRGGSGERHHGRQRRFGGHPFEGSRSHGRADCTQLVAARTVRGRRGPQFRQSSHWSVQVELRVFLVEDLQRMRSLLGDLFSSSEA
jgi:hypothetical protein